MTLIIKQYSSISVSASCGLLDVTLEADQLALEFLFKVIFSFLGRAITLSVGLVTLLSVAVPLSLSEPVLGLVTVFYPTGAA